MLSAYDDQLAAHGALIIERRLSFIDRLTVIAADLHRFLSNTRDELELIYQPSFPLGQTYLAGEIKPLFLSQLTELAREEEIRGKTLIGPQRDDLLLNVNAHDSRLYASQGQQRTIALALKLAERKLIQELVGEPPLLLLDDVLSDLDDTRQRKLFEQIAESGSQTFLTCTNLQAVPETMLRDGAVWRGERRQDSAGRYLEALTPLHFYGGCIEAQMICSADLSVTNVTPSLKGRTPKHRSLPKQVLPFREGGLKGRIGLWAEFLYTLQGGKSHQAFYTL